MPLQNPQNLNSQVPLNDDNLGNVQPNLPIDDLKSKFEEIKSKNATLQSRKFSSQNQLKDSKVKMLQEIFALMQKMHIDPNNLESINKFLQYLEQQDPDLLAMFENAMNELSPEQPQEGVEENSPNLMDRYSNLQQQVLRE